CVLYEMLTGRRAFPGVTISETIAAVLKSEPDWTPFASMPAPLETLVRRCLEKDPRRRLHDIADASIWLEEAQRPRENDARGPQTNSAATTGQSSRWVLAAGALAFTVVGFGAGAGVVKLTQRAVAPNDAPTLRFEFTPPPSAPFTTLIAG